MARFEYLEPHTVRQAIALLQRHGNDARVVAGSTDFLIRWRQGLWQPKYVINLQHILGLDRIRFSPRNGLRIGSLTPVQSIESDPTIRERYSALATGATSFAGVQIRNLATIGGNICNASPAGDTLSALLAFGAECKIIGAEGERIVTLDKFFTGPGRTVLLEDEILVEIRLPTPKQDSGSLYIKHSPRGAMDIATVGVASVISLQNRGRVCRDVKIGLASVAPTPIRAYTAEDMLRGQNITPDLLAAVAQETQNLASPIDDVRSTGAYRKSVVGALTLRTLENAVAIARKSPSTFESQRRLAIQTTF